MNDMKVVRSEGSCVWAAEIASKEEIMVLVRKIAAKPEKEALLKKLLMGGKIVHTERQ